MEDKRDMVFDPTSFFTNKKKEVVVEEVKDKPELKYPGSSENKEKVFSPHGSFFHADPSLIGEEPKLVTKEYEDAGKTEEEIGKELEKKAAISFGQKVNRYPIDRFKGIRGFNRRIGVLNLSKWYAVKTHYEDDMGSFYCFGGACCDLSDPALRYLAPVVVYSTDREANVVSSEFVIEYISLPPATYETFLLINKNYPLDRIDIIVVCNDEHYQKLTFQPAGNALWLKNESFKKQVWEEYLRLEKHILRRHARRLGANSAEEEITYKKIRGGSTGSADSVIDFDIRKFQDK